MMPALAASHRPRREQTLALIAGLAPLSLTTPLLRGCDQSPYPRVLLAARLRATVRMLLVHARAYRGARTCGQGERRGFRRQKAPALQSPCSRACGSWRPDLHGMPRRFPSPRGDHLLLLPLPPRHRNLQLSPVSDMKGAIRDRFLSGEAESRPEAGNLPARARRGRVILALAAGLDFALSHVRRSPEILRSGGRVLHFAGQLPRRLHATIC